MAALVEMYAQGVSTRKVKAIGENSAGTSSVMRARSANSTSSSMGNWSVLPGKTLAAEYPYLILDARYEKVREEGVIRSRTRAGGYRDD